MSSKTKGKGKQRVIAVDDDDSASGDSKTSRSSYHSFPPSPSQPISPNTIVVEAPDSAAPVLPTELLAAISSSSTNTKGELAPSKKRKTNTTAAAVAPPPQKKTKIIPASPPAPPKPMSKPKPAPKAKAAPKQVVPRASTPAPIRRSSRISKPTAKAAECGHLNSSAVSVPVTGPSSVINPTASKSSNLGRIQSQVAPGKNSTLSVDLSAPEPSSSSHATYSAPASKSRALGRIECQVAPGTTSSKTARPASVSSASSNTIIAGENCESGKFINFLAIDKDMSISWMEKTFGEAAIHFVGLARLDGWKWIVSEGGKPGVVHVGDSIGSAGVVFGILWEVKENVVEILRGGRQTETVDVVRVEADQSVGWGIPRELEEGEEISGVFVFRGGENGALEERDVVGMNRAIVEAQSEGMPMGWVGAVLRKWVPFPKSPKGIVW